MDWKALADQLALGEKQWEVFRDGAKAATLIWNLERAKGVLQAQYDVLPGQIAQAKEELASLMAQTEKARSDAAQAAAAQQQALAAAHAKQIASLQAECDAWGPKLSAVKAEFEKTLATQQAQLDHLMVKIELAKGQLDELERIKASLKAQLQEVM